MTNDAQNKLTGRALRAMRLNRKQSLQFLADRLDKAKQTLSAWEVGSVKLSDAHIDEYLSAMGATRADLEAEMVHLGEAQGAIVSFESAPWFKAYPEALGEMILNSDDLAPWAERGEKVLYERDRHPLREQACVAELKDGRTLARFFVKSADGRAFLRSNSPDETESFLWSDVRGLHRIVLRGT